MMSGSSPSATETSAALESTPIPTATVVPPPAPHIGVGANTSVTSEAVTAVSTTTAAGAPCAPASVSTKALTMESTGDNIIREHYEGYETAANSSFLLPPLVLSKFPEERTPGVNPGDPGAIPKPSQALTKKEENQLQGISIDQRGELAETEVFNLLHQLSQTMQSYQFIALKDIDLDNNNDSSVKERELKKELPSIDLSSVDMKGEHDFIIIIKHVGAIVMEVKTTAGAKSIEKAEKQLKNSQSLVQAVMGGITGTGTSFVPVEKVIICPYELNPSPASITPENSHQIHKDLLSQFQTEFEKIVDKLKSTPGSLFTDADFDRFTRIMIGFWCLTPMKASFVFNRALASRGSLTKEVDRRVRQAEISSFKKGGKLKRPVSDVAYCGPPNKAPRMSKDIDAIFLTPQQKNILDNEPQALIVGGAGTGKTLITLLKCVDIIEKNPTDKILLVVPSPHDIRCQNILKANNIKTKIIKKFIKKFITSASIFIIQLESFFSVPTRKFAAYNLSPFHVFIDDAQAYKLKKFTNFADISIFLDTHYIAAHNDGKHFWCSVDVVQGAVVSHRPTSSSQLLFDDSGKRRLFQIPIMELKKVLRNSSNIIPFVTNMREEKIDYWKDTNKLPHLNFSSVTPGHNITGEPVHYHTLKQKCDQKQCEKFVVQMIGQELNIILKKQSMHGENGKEKNEEEHFHPSDIGILISNLNRIKGIRGTIESFLKKNFGISCHTIEDSLTKSTTSCVVLDVWDKVMSYEVPCVILVGEREWTAVNLSAMYVASSRARSRLTVIDADGKEQPMSTETITLTTWEEQNGSFVQLSAVPSGHNGTVEPVHYHQMKQGSHFHHRETFVIQMVEHELNILFQKQPAVQPSDVTILLESFASSLKDTIENLLKQKFDIACHRYEHRTEENTKCMVLDEFDEGKSYEVPCMILIGNRGHWADPPLNATLSLPPAGLTIIDFVAALPPIDSDLVTYITWEEQNGSFVKV